MKVTGIITEFVQIFLLTVLGVAFMPSFQLK